MKKYTLYVGRLSKKTGNFAESKPCNHCLKMIKKYGIKKIVYSTDQGLVKQKTSQLQSQHESIAFRQLRNYCRV